jgi:hypothetical protein
MAALDAATPGQAIWVTLAINLVACMAGATYDCCLRQGRDGT